MKAIIQKSIWLFFIAVAMTSCSKDDEPNKEANGECWYKVTIDGQTTRPNQFGQDRISLTAALDNEDSGFGFGISQAKGNGAKKTDLIMIMHGILNKESSTGIYPVLSFAVSSFNTPSYEQYPLYAFGEEGDEYKGTNITFNVVENSDRRLHVKASGTTIKLEEIGDELVITGIVPVEVEIIIGRENVFEIPVNGIFISGTHCDCQKK